MNHRIQSSNTLLNGLLLGWSENQETKSISPIWDNRNEGHLLTIAPTGGGKGVSCAIPALLTWQGPAIVVDPRGELYAITAERRRAMGHAVHRLDPFLIGANTEGDSLNPLDLIDPSSDDFEDNAAVVAQLCMQHHSTHQDPYWDERANTLVNKVICGLFRELPSRQPTLRDVQNIIAGLPIQDASALPPAFRNMEANAPSQKITLSHIVTSSEFASDRTRAAIFSTANSHLGFMRSPAVHASLTDSTITLDDITAGAMQTIYVIIPPDKLISHAKLFRLWIGVMLAAICRRRRAPPQPTLFLIDEAAQLGEMNELRTALTLMRGYGLRVWTFWQCISQLQRLYGKDWETIINNSAVQQFFSAKAPHSRKLLASFIGDDMPKDGLPSDQQLLFDGEGLAMVRRANYLNDKLFEGLASPHPFHQQQPHPALH